VYVCVLLISTAVTAGWGCKHDRESKQTDSGETERRRERREREERRDREREERGEREEKREKREKREDTGLVKVEPLRDILSALSKFNFARNKLELGRTDSIVSIQRDRCTERQDDWPLAGVLYDVNVPESKNFLALLRGAAGKNKLRNFQKACHEVRDVSSHRMIGFFFRMIILVAGPIILSTRMMAPIP
jgi:hypothetical protein